MNQPFRLGEMQTLKIVKTTDFGVYLGNDIEDQSHKVLLPKRQVPPNPKIGHYVDVFIYKDSEDRLIATTTTPALTIGRLNVLPVKDVGTIGAFLDWGLSKDLLLPFKEQTHRVNVGDEVLVTLYIDKSNRLCATMKVYDYLSTDSPYQKDDTVTGIVYETSKEFGVFVAVDNQYSALIPQKEVFHPFTPGDRITARVTSVKEDGKLDLSIRKKVFLQMDEDSTIILQKLEEHQGFLPYHDKSDAEDIKQFFHLSKNAFKRAIGRLLKEGQITLTENGIKKK